MVGTYRAEGMMVVKGLAALSPMEITNPRIARRITRQLGLESMLRVYPWWERANEEIAEWVGVPVKRAPTLYFSTRMNSDGWLHLRGRQSKVFVKCNVYAHEIRETLYHELLHHYIPDGAEDFIGMLEKEFLKGTDFDVALMLLMWRDRLMETLIWILVDKLMKE